MYSCRPFVLCGLSFVFFVLCHLLLMCMFITLSSAIGVYVYYFVICHWCVCLLLCHRSSSDAALSPVVTVEVCTPVITLWHAWHAEPHSTQKLANLSLSWWAVGECYLTRLAISLWCHTPHHTGQAKLPSAAVSPACWGQLHTHQDKAVKLNIQCMPQAVILNI